MVSEGKTLVTEGKTLVTKEKTLVTEEKTLVTKEKTSVTEVVILQREGEGKAPQLPAGARTEGPVGP